MIDNLKTYNVNVEYLSEIFGVDIRTVQMYAKNNGLPKDERGEYPLVDCLLWFIKKQKDTIKDLAEINPLTISRKEAIDLSNQRRQIELEQKRNTLVEKDLVEMAFVTILKMLGRNADSIAPRLMKKLNGDAKTLAVIREEITEYKNLCANTQLNYFEDEFEQLNESQS